MTAALMGSSELPGAVRPVSAPLRANPRGLSAPPMGPVQATLLPRSAGDPITYWLYFHKCAA
jgi:hypothetical protein